MQIADNILHTLMNCTFSLESQSLQFWTSPTDQMRLWHPKIKCNLASRKDWNWDSCLFDLSKKARWCLCQFNMFQYLTDNKDSPNIAAQVWILYQPSTIFSWDTQEIYSCKTLWQTKNPGENNSFDLVVLWCQFLPHFIIWCSVTFVPTEQKSLDTLLSKHNYLLFSNLHITLHIFTQWAQGFVWGNQ